MRRVSTINWIPQHVKGHQDEHLSELNLWATLNIQVDQFAKQHLKIATISPRHSDIEGEPWQLWVGNKKVTSKIASTIYSWVHDEKSKKYWAGKEDVSEEAVSLVVWKSIGVEMRPTCRARRVFITKHTAGMCGVRSGTMRNAPSVENQKMHHTSGSVKARAQQIYG